jgi:hypothetical protein
MRYYPDISLKGLRKAMIEKSITVMPTHLVNSIYVGSEVLTALVMESSVFCYITPRNPLKLTNVLEEHVSSMSRVEEYAKQETSMKAGGKKSQLISS